MWARCPGAFLNLAEEATSDLSSAQRILDQDAFRILYNGYVKKKNLSVTHVDYLFFGSVWTPRLTF